MFEYYHASWMKSWGGQKRKSKNLGGHGPPGLLGSATYELDPFSQWSNYYLALVDLPCFTIFLNRQDSVGCMQD